MNDYKEITIAKPDDYHLHLREGKILTEVINYSCLHYNRAVIMPNLKEPVVQFKQLELYYQEIMSLLPSNSSFKPLMTLYLTEETTADDLKKAKDSEYTIGAKLYPDGATTNSKSGVRGLNQIASQLETMEKIGLNLLVHGETGDAKIDVFDKEKYFIDNFVEVVVAKLPNLNLTLEHITTKYAVDFVLSASENVAASITPHHLMLDRNHLLADGIRPHYYCKPILKRSEDKEALIRIATSGNKKFFFGSDSAPHLTANKEAEIGCAGVFSAINAINCLTQLFDDENSISNLEAFTSSNGSKFYKLPLNNNEKITLSKNKEAIKFPKTISTEEGSITVFQPVNDIYWQIK